MSPKVAQEYRKVIYLLERSARDYLIPDWAFDDLATVALKNVPRELSPFVTSRLMELEMIHILRKCLVVELEVKAFIVKYM